MTNIDIDNSDVELQVTHAKYTCEASWEWDHRSSTFWGRNSFLVWVVTGGVSTLLVNNETRYDVRRGDVFLMPSQGNSYEGRQSVESPIQVFWMCITFHSKSRDQALPINGIKGIPFHVHPEDFGACQLMAERLTDASAYARNYWAFCLLHEIKRQVAMESGTPAEQQIRRVVQSVRRNPGEFHGIGDMSKGMHMSKDHFIRLFKRQMNVAPGEFLIRSRIDHARGLLVSGQLSIKEISATLGYSDQCVFSRQFKERVGVSPSDFRHGNG